MTDVDTTQFDNKGSRAAVKSTRAKLKINEVRDVEWGWGESSGLGKNGDEIVKLDEMRIASNEEVVCDVDSGEDAGRGDLWLRVVTNKVTLCWG